MAKAGADERLCRSESDETRGDGTNQRRKEQRDENRDAAVCAHTFPGVCSEFADGESLIALLRKGCRRHVARRHVKRDRIGHMAVTTRRTPRAREQTTAPPQVVCGGIEAKADAHEPDAKEISVERRSSGATDRTVCHLSSRQQMKPDSRIGAKTRKRRRAGL